MSVKLDHGSDELEENHEINVTPMDLTLHRSFPSLVVMLVVSPCRVHQRPADRLSFYATSLRLLIFIARRRYRADYLGQTKAQTDFDSKSEWRRKCAYYAG
jgi:hypothetical protein